MCAFARCGDGATGVSGSADADGDGISNANEGSEAKVNTDADDYADWLDLDSDGDGILDADEAGDKDAATPPRDTDGDGIADFRDDDSDGDGLKDTEELDASFAIVDSDQDGTPDHLDLDSDDDTIADRMSVVERPTSTTFRISGMTIAMVTGSRMPSRPETQISTHFLSIVTSMGRRTSWTSTPMVILSPTPKKTRMATGLSILANHQRNLQIPMAMAHRISWKRLRAAIRMIRPYRFRPVIFTSCCPISVRKNRDSSISRRTCGQPMCFSRWIRRVHSAKKSRRFKLRSKTPSCLAWRRLFLTRRLV